MGGWAILLAFLCFLAPMALPLFALRWGSFLRVLLAAAVFFAWLTIEVKRPGTIAYGIGSFLGGLMLTGFAFGALARFVTLLGRRPEEPSPTDSSTV